MSKIIKYNHHGTEVSVLEKNKGKHRKNCLCWICKLFIPNDRELNCKISNELFAICVTYNVTTPVWECAKFVEKGMV
ncbi:MAG: hypothetical protein E3J83_03300 [Candidatus Atribacteria bacterium]|nr:MAG: hypothetical protein E3J83_03300 [Candidatus Atribacteria bacterium]